MILVGGADTSFSYQRPAPVFVTEERPLSTKKARGTPKFAAPPPAPVKSCPVTRIFSHITSSDGPQAVSFREDSDTSFIVQSSVYKAEKPALYFEQCFVTEERLGVGSFGEVFRVRSKEDGCQYACKRSLLRFRGEGDRRRKMEEVQKHEKLPKHRNCVEFFRAWEERRHLYLLTELCHTSLALLAHQRHDLPEQTIWYYLHDLLQAVNHLHKNNLVHMDIKPENIFLGYDGLCKLGDFGLVIDMCQGVVHEAVEGDPRYLAPEVMKQQFGPQADLFSLGMTVLELATDLDLPRQGEAWQRLRQGTLPPAAMGLSAELRQVLEGLLHPDPYQRLTAVQALQLPHIKKLHLRRTLHHSLNACVGGVRWLVVQMWLYLLVLLTSLTRPLARLRTSTTTTTGGHLETPNTSGMMNHSDSDFTVGFSDDEGDHSLAQPLSDTSSSSEHNNLGHHCINSTPISHHHSGHRPFPTASPHLRNGLNASPCLPETPFMIRRTPLTRSNHHVRHSKSMSALPSVLDSSLDPRSMTQTTVEEEDCVPSLNMTSRNLIALFNAANDEDDE